MAIEVTLLQSVTDDGLGTYSRKALTELKDQAQLPISVTLLQRDGPELGRIIGLRIDEDKDRRKLVALIELNPLGRDHMQKAKHHLVHAAMVHAFQNACRQPRVGSTPSRTLELLRAGTYHDGVTFTAKALARLVIQSPLPIRIHLQKFGPVGKITHLTMEDDRLMATVKLSADGHKAVENGLELAAVGPYVFTEPPRFMISRAILVPDKAQPT